MEKSYKLGGPIINEKFLGGANVNLRKEFTAENGLLLKIMFMTPMYHIFGSDDDELADLYFDFRHELKTMGTWGVAADGFYEIMYFYMPAEHFEYKKGQKNLSKHMNKFRDKYKVFAYSCV